MLKNITKHAIKFACSSTCTRNYATRKRFYRKTSVLQNDGRFEVTLDQRKLKTPTGSLFQVESEPLALAVAAEWDAQLEKIQQSKMHLTGLACTAIDNPKHLTKYDMVQEMISYLDTDTILFTSSEEDELYDLQVKEWEPVIDWFCSRYKVKVEAARNITGPIITPETKAVISKHLLSYNMWAVHGFSYAVETLKSIILALCCADRYISVEKAVALCRLEEDYQCKRWGRVEWAHDLNEQDLQARVAAAVLFIHLNSSSTLIKQKTSFAS